LPRKGLFYLRTGRIIHVEKMAEYLLHFLIYGWIFVGPRILGVKAVLT